MRLPTLLFLFLAMLLAAAVQAEQTDFIDSSDLEDAVIVHPSEAQIAECFRSLHAEEATANICLEALDQASDPTRQALVASAAAVLAARAGELTRAQFLIDQALQLEPDNPEVLINLGNIRIKQSRFDEAIEAYGRAQDSGAIGEPALYLNRSLALRALGRYADARQDYEYYLTLTRTSDVSSDIVE